MKRLGFILLALFFGHQLSAQRVQVVHNAAAPALATVDIWVNGSKTLPDVKFRSATGFLTLPEADREQYQIQIKPAGSTEMTPALLIQNVTVAKDETAYLIANGVAGDGFLPNPDGVNTAAQLYKVPAVERAAEPGSVALTVFHGATDAPAVTVKANGNPLINNVRYASVQPTPIQAPAADYLLTLALGSDANVNLISYSAPLSDAKGEAVLVLASGFLDSAKNNGGSSFQLIAVSAEGEVVPLPVPQTKLQAVHNSADPAAATVDVVFELANLPMLGPVLKADRFAFRTATPFVDLPAETPLRVKVLLPGTSTVVGNFVVPKLDLNTNFTAFVNGVAAAEGFAPNPNAQPIVLNLYPNAPARREGDTGKVTLNVFHGCTDAPAVDAVVRANGFKLADNLLYGRYSAYNSVDPGDYVVDVKAAGQTAALVSYRADLRELAGGSATVFASGFLDPTKNKNGAGFGLFAVFATGTVVPLPVVTPSEEIARVQIIHNSADPAATSVDIEVLDKNGTRITKLERVAYLSGTAFLPISVESSPLTVRVFAPGGTEPLGTFAGIGLEKDKNYIVFAHGVLNPANFDATVNSNIGFGLQLTDQARLTAAKPEEVDILVHHGCTDAPKVDIKVAGNNLVEGAEYPQIYAFVSVPPASYDLSVVTSSDQITRARFRADARTLAGQSVSIFASGFLNPARNQNGNSFGLYLMTPAGGAAIPLPNITSRNEINVQNLSLYPNPTNDKVVIKRNASSINGVITLQDVLGKTVGSYSLTQGQNEFSVKDVPGGVYSITLTEGDNVYRSKIVIEK